MCSLMLLSMLQQHTLQQLCLRFVQWVQTFIVRATAETLLSGWGVSKVTRINN